MMRKTSLIMLLAFTILVPACSQQPSSKETAGKPEFSKKTKAELKKELSPIQYHVLCEKGTEQPFTGSYLNNHAQGVYYCAACHQQLFDSETKYESGSGWPSFYKPANDSSVIVRKDTSYGMVRDEIVCGRCGGHLGHVFPDGPNPTGLRYCTNSAALDFEPAKPTPKKNKSH